MNGAKYSYEINNGTIYKIPEGFLKLLDEQAPKEIIFIKAWECVGSQYIDISYESVQYSVMLQDDNQLNFAYFNLNLKSWYLIPFFNYQFTFNNKLIEANSFNEFHEKVMRILKSQVLL